MKKYKNQIEMFNDIWENREHVSELTGELLFAKYHFLWFNQFLHILPKGTFPRYKLNPENIILATPDEHKKQETFKIFQDKKLKLKQEYYKKYYGKKF